MKWLFLLFIILFFLVFFGILAAIIYVIRKSTKPKSQQFIQNEHSKMQKYVHDKRSSLADWSNYSYKDIGFSMRYFYKKTMSYSLKGTLHALDLKPTIAFNRVERGFSTNGYLFASSTEFDLFYDIRVNEYTIHWNQELLGHIKQTGHLLNANNEIIGHAKHPKKIAIHGPLFDYRVGDNTFPLTMNNRKLASIKVAPDLSNTGGSTFAFSNENSGAGSILEVLDTPTPEEEKWLTALAVLEIAFHGYWMI